MKSILLVSSLVVMLMPNLSGAKGDPELGKSKSEACVACHNVDGNSTVPLWPKIAGQHQNYIYEQIMEVKKGDKGARNVPTMYPIVEKLDETDVLNLSAYFASNKMTLGSAKPELAELGKKIYLGGNKESGVPACIACHGPNGNGNYAAKYPKLSGQHSEYVADQLRKYKSGERATDLNSMMRMISKKLSDEEIEAVSSYVSGLS